MGTFEDRAVKSSQEMEQVRQAVERGQGAEAKRLADKFKIPNALRLDLGVELSSDSTLNKPLRFEGAV
jgi:hypothetical protein